MRRVLLFALLAAAAGSLQGLLSAAGGPAQASPFPWRAFRLPGPASDPGVRGYVELCERRGFNAIWIDGRDAGRWGPPSAGGKPLLDPAFQDLAARFRSRGTRMIVSIAPAADAGERFLFDSRDGERRILRFVRLLRRAGVRDFVLSFEGAPPEIHDLRDFLRYGRSAAPAHLDLARRIERGLEKDERLWLRAVVSCDAHLGDGGGPYVARFLAGLESLPARVGIVWTGATPVSASISADGIRKARERLGMRDVLLYDDFAPIDGGDDAIAAYLGPLRDRDPRLAEEVAVYVAVPGSEPGASRLPMLTAVDWLSDPAAYDADAAWRRATAGLAGPDAEAAEALRVQALEWRGWDMGKRFRPWDPASSASAARTLDDPALAAEWVWTVQRYPGRMAALARLDDGPFRESVLDLMARRLAIARAVPPAIEYLARKRAGRTDLEPLVKELRRQRAEAEKRPSVLRALDRFLEAAEIPPPPL
jgi:hypothetical protein